MNLSQFVALTCRQLSPFAARSDAHSDGAGVANRVASDVALRDYHHVANPVLTVLLTTLRTLLLRLLPRVITTLLRTRC